MAAESKEKKKKRPAKKSRIALPGDAQVNPRKALAQNPLLPDETVQLHGSVEPADNGPRLAPRPVPPPAEHVRLPPVSQIRCFNTTRLLPAKYSESVLTRIADNDADLQAIFALDHATNDRLLAEGNLRLGITARELVFDVPHHRIINAAFTHPHPLGARFSMPYRGAWYAGLELATAKAEVLFHRAVQFAEIGWQQPEEMEYDQYTADFSGTFHDLRPSAFSRSNLDSEPSQAGHTIDHPGNSDPSNSDPFAEAEAQRRRTHLQIQAAQAPPIAAEFAACLALDSYIASQQLALQLLEAGSLGILYPSARRAGGNCIACFRPSVVANVRKRDLYCLRWYPDRAAAFVRTPRTLPSPEPPVPAGAQAGSA